MRIYALSFTEDLVTFHDPVLLRTLKPYVTPIITAAIDWTGTLLATGSADGVVKVWDIRGGYVTHTFRGHAGVISALCFFERTGGSGEQESLNKSQRETKNKRRSSGGDANDPLANDDAVSSVFHLASGSDNGKMQVWSLTRRRAIANLDSHVSVIRGISFSRGPEILISASRDKTVILWDVREWTIIRVIPVFEALEAVGFLSNDRLIYTGGENGNIRIWDRQNGQELTQEQPSGSQSMAISHVLHNPYQDLLLSVDVESSLVLYSTAHLADQLLSEGMINTIPVLRRISGTHDEIIDAAYVTQDRSIIALASNSESVKLVNVSGDVAGQAGFRTSAYFGADIASLEGHEDIIICLDVDWSGCWLATGAKDNTARLWRIDHQHDTYECTTQLTGHAESLGAISFAQNPPPVDSAAYKLPLAHPPPFLLTGSQDRTVKKWAIATSFANSTKSSNRAIYTRKAHDKDINAIATNQNASLFASASQDKTVKIWCVEEGEVQGVLRGHRRGVWSVRFAPKGTPTMSGEHGPASASRGLVLTGSGDKTVKVWSLADYRCLRTFEGHTNSVLKVLWMPTSLPSDPSTASAYKNSAHMASAGGDGLVKVWDADSGEACCTLDNHTDRVWALTVNPENRMLVSGGGDGVITFWKDTTTLTRAAVAAAATQRVEQEQQLQNHIHHGSYREAIVLALELNHPARLLALLQDVTATSPPEQDSLSGVKAVDEILIDLSDGQLLILMQRLRDWNTNARTAIVAQRILGVVLKSYPAAKLAGLRGRGWKEILEALRVYTERHYKRVEDLVDESYLLEYTLGEMEVVGDDIKVLKTANDMEGDVIMV